MIYLDNAATSYMRPAAVAEAVACAICTMGNSARGTYAQAMDAGRMLLETRQMLADMVHAEGADCVAFAMNSTHALNVAIQGSLAAGDVLITTVLEHNSVLRPAYLMEKRGVKLEIVGADADGRLDMQAFEAMLAAAALSQQGEIGVSACQPHVVVAMTHASNLTGNVVDIRQVGQLCRRYGARLIVDASQSLGVLPLDMQADAIDILCFTGHKALMGPQGTGGLVLRRGIALEPLMQGGSGIQTFLKHMPEKMPDLLEAGTQNAHSLAGLHAALNETKRYGEQLLRMQQEEAAGEHAAAAVMPEEAKMQSAFALQQETEERSSATAANDGKRYRALAAETEAHAVFAAAHAAYYEKETDLRKQFLTGLQALNESYRRNGAEAPFRVYGAQADVLHAAIVSLNVCGEDSAVVSDILSQEYGIATRSGGHCAPLMHLHFGTEEQGMVRFSFSHYNTEGEVAEALRALAEIAEDCMQE